MSGAVAAIDCGTNTIKLLVGEPPHAVLREMRMVRLGEGLDASGRIGEAALGRAFAAIDEYAAIIAEHDVPTERIRFCATSASRDAENAAQFVAGVRARLGVAPEVLSGAEEAALSFTGAVRHLRAEPAWPVLVVDIGGGSTELVLGDRSGPQSAHSMDIGSVRLHERHLADDPPTAAQVEALLADVDAALAACPVPAAEAATVVGVAGTVTTVAAAVLDLAAYDRAALDQQVLDVDDVHAAVQRLVGLSVAERRELPYLHPGRADVIGAGALIWSRVLEHAGVRQVVVSECDILDGIAASIG
ncbi:exopolyphosphatase [Nocardioides nanhaiensis]|uniref:Ppx/GppA phosphatase family protein n=1 Tax=Nocardioides nanhaiensis TaxID=1476871 RepID=A0ABP8W0I0_9ACTN